MRELINFLRIISILFLIIITIIDIPLNYNLKNPQIQFIIAFIILIIFLLIDSVFGFILAIIFLIIYSKVYNKFLILNIINENNDNSNSNSNGNNLNNYNDIIKLNYISPEHLISAQNNIVDINNYNTEIKGIKKGLNNENVYGAQGIDTDNNNYIGYENIKYQLF